MKRTIKVELSAESINTAIKELEAYKREMETKVRMLVKNLTFNGANIAKAKVHQMGIILDLELTSSIEGFVSGNKGFVFVNDTHALWFEFGTGPIGKREPHPLLSRGDYKPQGWYTKADGKLMDVLYDWQPITLMDGTVIYWTEGQKSKPFMYETALKLRDEFATAVKEVFP